MMAFMRIDRPARRTERRRVGTCLGLSLALHLLAGVLWVTRELPSPMPEEFPVRKFVKPLPPSRRTLARRQLPEAIQRPLSRWPAVSAVPALAVVPPPLTTQRQGLPGMPIPLMTAPPPPAEIPVQPLAHLPTPHIGPQFQAGALHGTRTGADEIDLDLELLAVDALDTGRHRALVVVDPQDQQKLKGFLYLSGIYSDAQERAEAETSNLRSGRVPRQVAERRTLQGLADKMSERTGVRAQVLDGLALDDPQLLQAPFLLLTVNHTCAFTEAEARNLGRYLVSGGFLYTEVVSGPRAIGGGYEYDLPELRALVRQALHQVGKSEGKEWSFARLELGHPLYHCYYEVAGPPRGFWDWPYTFNVVLDYHSPDYLEGILVEGLLVGVYSQKDYADFWAGEAERIREKDEVANLVNGRFSIGGEELKPYDLGINILVYALTREGSLAQKLVAVE